MDWGGIGKMVAKMGVPLLGQVLGGPVAGGITSLVADVLGVDDEPEAVQTAIERDPEGAKERLADLQERNRAQLQTLVMQGKIEEARQNAQAYQTELASNDPYITRWRPRLGRRVTDIIIAVAAAHVVVMFVGAGMLIFMEGGVALVGAMTALIKELGAEIIRCCRAPSPCWATRSGGGVSTRRASAVTRRSRTS